MTLLAVYSYLGAVVAFLLARRMARCKTCESGETR